MIAERTKSALQAAKARGVRLGTKAQELKQLMNRAEQGAGGAVVNVLAYQADYVRATEELKMLERAARSKHCSTPENWSSNFAIH